MPTVEVKLYGFSDFRADLRRLDAVARGKAILSALRFGGVVLSEAIIANIVTNFYRNPSGRMANAVGMRENGDRLEVGVFGVVYARIHEFGGIITPKVAKMLSWVSLGGKRIFAKQVIMPARPYIRPAIAQSNEDMAAAIGDALVTIFRETVGK